MFRNLKIGTKIIVGFLLVALTPLVVVSYLSFSNARNTLESAAIQELTTIASLKADKIEAFFNELKLDAEVAQDYFNVKTHLPTMTQFVHDRTNPKYMTAKKALDSQLKALQEVKGFNDVVLASSEGNIVYAVNELYAAVKLGEPLSYFYDGAFEEGKKEIYFSDIFSSRIDNTLTMLGAAPIHDFNEKFIGVIAFEFDVGRIYEIIQDTTGLGKTGETFIGRNEGDHALFLNSLRHDKDAALKRKAFFGEKDTFPLQEAVQGRNGFGISVDYRGEEVIAAWQYIPSPNWGMVAKIDIKEAFAPVVALRNEVLLINGIVLFVSLSLAYYITRSLSKPIVAVRNAAQEIKQGNLNKRVEIKSKDEIGQLAAAFNEMAAKLKESYEGLEEKVSVRTKELEEEKSKIDAILHSIGDGVFVVDRDYKIMMFNQVAADISGFIIEEMLGTKYGEILKFVYEISLLLLLFFH